MTSLLTQSASNETFTKVERPSLNEQEIRRIFGYQPADSSGALPEITATLTPIKRHLQTALKCEIFFERQTDNSYSLFFKPAIASQTGDIARSLKRIVGKLAEPGARQRAHFEDFLSTIAQTEQQWDTKLSAEDPSATHRVKIGIGATFPPDKDSYRDWKSKEGAFLNARVFKNDEDVTSDNTQKAITREFIETYNALKLEIEKSRPLDLISLRDAAVALKEESLVKAINQEIEPATTLATAVKEIVGDAAFTPNRRHLIYIPQSLLHTFIEDGAPPEDIAEYLREIANKFGVLIDVKKAPDLTIKKLPAPLNIETQEPESRADIEQQLQQAEKERRAAGSDLDQARSAKKKGEWLQQRLDRFARYEAHLSSPPTGRILIDDEHALALNATALDQNRYPAILISPPATLSATSTDANLKQVSGIVQKLITAWEERDKTQVAYERKLRDYDLPGKLLNYNKRHNKAIFQAARLGFMGGSVKDTVPEVVLFIDGFKKAFENFQDRNKADENTDTYKPRQVTAIRKALKAEIAKIDRDPKQTLPDFLINIQNEALDTMIGKMIEASALFTKANDHPAKTQPRAPSDALPDLIQKALTPKPTIYKAKPEPTKRPEPDLIPTELTLKRVASELTEQLQRVQAREELVAAFFATVDKTVACGTVRIMDFVTGKIAAKGIPPHIHYINGALGVKLELPPKELMDIAIIKIPTGTNPHKAQQAQQVLEEIVSRAKLRDRAIDMAEVQSILKTVQGQDTKPAPAPYIEADTPPVRRAVAAPDSFMIPLGKAAHAFNKKTLDALQQVMGPVFALTDDDLSLVFPTHHNSGLAMQVVNGLIKAVEGYSHQKITVLDIQQRFYAAKRRAVLDDFAQTTPNGSKVIIDSLALPGGNSTIVDILQIHAPEDPSWTAQCHVHFSDQDRTTYEDLCGKNNLFLKKIAERNQKIRLNPGKNRTLVIQGNVQDIAETLAVITKFEALLTGGMVDPNNPKSGVRETALEVALGLVPEDALLDPKRKQGTHISPLVAKIELNPSYIKPLGDEQAELCAAMEARDSDGNPTYPYIAAPGPAGVGKTLMAITKALMLMKNPAYPGIQRLVCCGPDASVTGHKRAFLPGSQLEKLAPTIGMFVQHFEKHFGHDMSLLEGLIKNKVIQFIPPADLRGMSFENSIIILDETQNAGQRVFDTMIERPHHTSMLLVLGDPGQGDLVQETKAIKKELKTDPESAWERDETLMVPKTVRIEDGHLLIEQNGKVIKLPNATKQGHWIREDGANDVLKAVVPYNALTYLMVAYNNMPEMRLIDFTKAPQLRNKAIVAMAARRAALRPTAQMAGVLNGRGLIELKS